MTAAADPSLVPSLLYSDTEEELRGLIRNILADIAPWATTVARLDQERVPDERLWQALSNAGIPGLLVPERLGGAGASAREMAVVLEEMGRSVAPAPLLTSAVIATVTLICAGSAAESWVHELAAGTAIAALAVPCGARPDATRWDNFHAKSEDSGARLLITGRVDAVVGADSAHLLVVPGQKDSEPVLAVVDARDEAVTIEVACSLDATRPVASVDLRAAPSTIVASGTAAADALSRGLVAGTALLASELLGVADSALDLACEHLRTRYQFGRLLGSFQALRHRAADLWTRITGARAVARYAAACLADSAPDVELAAHLAQAVCSELALETAEGCLQMMGGIGFTWEHPTHLLLKRAAASHGLLGTPEAHRTRIGQLRGIPPSTAAS